MVRMRIEEPQLQAAMNRIERLIDVERDPFRKLPEGRAIGIDDPDSAVFPVSWKDR